MGVFQLKSVFLTLNRYCKSWKGSRYIRIKSYSTTAIAYLKNLRGERSGGRGQGPGWVSVCKVQYIF